MVRGRVFTSDRTPISGIRVRAFDHDVRSEDFLGETTTNADGYYEIRYTAEQFRRSENERGGADLIVRVYDAQGQVIATSPTINNAKAEETIDIVVQAQQPPSESDPTVQGEVRSRNRSGVDGLRVVIVDKNVGADVQLVTTTTDGQGNYQVRYKQSALQQRGKQKPDLQARVFSGEIFLGASEVRYNASTNETLNVLLPETADAALASEHQTLMRDLTAQFKGNLRDLQETDDRKDITYLANKTGWDARAVAIASLADQFSARTANANGQVQIAPPFFYALFRAGIPANENALYQLDAKTTETVWQKAIDQGVIPANLKEQLPQVREQFQVLAARQMLASPAVTGVSSLKDMLSVSLNQQVDQERFAQLYTQHRGEPSQFWQAVQDTFGVQVGQRLQLDGQLGYLTINNAPLIRKLHSAAGQNGLSNAVNLVEQGYFRAENWQNLIGDLAVPKEVPGKDDAEKRTNYSELLATQVRLSFPTAVIAQMVRSGETPLQNGAGEQVHAFLNQHQGQFEIGMQPVEQYIARNNLRIAPEVTQEVKRIQRVYQITPSDRVMNTLLGQGLDSAYAIVNRYDRDEFVQTFKETLGGEDIAQLTYAKSEQVHNVVLNLATSYLTTNRAPGIGLGGQFLNPQILGTTGETASDVIAYPTLENLLGEMDYCTCEHCRSILSPAAYLVDLLLFCDRPINERKNPQAVLLERRPDIQYLPLTCENTNTPLPYIDLVNETLEYFITHNLSLNNYEGHSTDSDATPEELLATPQFVSDTAYTTLANTLFPAPLPFHQPLENLRRYFDQFEISLSHAMELLRKNDAIDRASPNDYGWRDILMEELHLSRTEYGLLSDRTLTLQQLYGFNPATPIANVLSTLANAKTFTRRIDISYEDLIEILRTRFINPNSDLIPKLERLGVPFSTLKNFKDGTITDAQFDALLKPGLDAAQYGGDIKAWVKNDTNYAKIMGLIVLTNPTAASDLCRFDQLEFRYANPDNTTNQLRPFEYVRLLRFIRLWKKVGWTIEQTDKAISALYPTMQLPNDPDDAVNLQRLDTGFLTLLPRLGYIKQVMGLLNLNLKRDLPSLLACFSAINTHGMTSLYHQMFLRPSLLKQESAFADDGYGNVLQKVEVTYSHAQPTLEQSILDAAANQIAYDDAKKLLSYHGVLTTAARDALKAVAGVTAAFQAAIDQLYAAQRLFAHTETLRAAFNLTNEEFFAIATSLNFNAETLLSLDNLSSIFRRGWLARKLKLSVQEFLLLTQFTGFDPFIAPAPANPTILQLIKLVNRLRQVSLKPVEALYLIWNQDISGKSVPPETEILGFARSLRAGFAALESEFALTTDPDGQIAHSRMALVYGNEATDFFFGLLGNTLTSTVTYSHGQPTLEQPILDIAPGQVVYDDFRKQLIFRGVLTLTLRDALKGVAVVTAQFQAAVDSLYTENQQIINPFFDRYPELRPLYDAFAASADPIEKKRSDLLSNFLPALKQRRKQQQAMQAIGAAAKVDVSFASSLVDSANVLHAAQDNTQPVLNDLLALETMGLAAQFFFRDTATGTIDLSRDAEANLNYAAPSNPLPANPVPASGISGIWSGYLEAPENGFYNLRIEADAGATITLKLAGTPIPLIQNGTRWSNSTPIELRAGTLYAIDLKAEKIEDSLSVRWQTAGRGWEVIPSAYLYSATLTSHLRTAYIRFLKVTSLAIALKLTANEIAYFATQTSYQIAGQGWLNSLPITGSPDSATSTSLLPPFNGLLDFARIKAELSPDDERLLTVLKDPATPIQKDLTTTTTSNPNSLPFSLLFSLTRWETNSLDALLTHFGKVIGDLSQIEVFARIYNAYQIVKQIGIPATALILATTNEPTGTTVRKFQSALRARYDESNWLQVLKPINDGMRGLQRDALVAYILHQMRSNPATAHIDTPDKLFEYFLMDVQMEPCMQTSRIRHALSSVQLFIERCLMNLEQQEVAPSSFESKQRKQWEWMKRYRVWEANRKVFLYPENWLEPELRDDQSPFFKETMSELLQGDITEDRAAEALLNYLTKLEEVAKLEPCGIHYVENDPGTADDIAHVVARTTGASRKYFYRRREYGYWTPWEQIKLDIEDNPVLPVVWRDRLFLFWLRIIKQTPLDAAQGASSSNSTDSKKLAEINLGEVKQSTRNDAKTATQITVQALLCWSEYFNGKWQPVRTSDINQPLSLGQYDISAFDRSKLALSAFFWTGGELRIIVSNEIGAGASFFLYNTHSSPELRNEKKNRHFAPKRILDTGTDTLKINYPNSNITQSILKNGITDRTLEPHHPLSGSPWDAPFFYTDSRHAFYVTTSQRIIRIPLWLDFGVVASPPIGKLDIPPLVLPPVKVIPDPIGPVINQPGFGVVNPNPIERYVTEDAYINRGIGSMGTVRFGNQEIGPAGSQVNVIRTR
ncbi:PA14 domain-containing protein,virulence plasmid 28 protein [Microcystis aeruginosa BLCCF158]|uniref:PA14 domain-containing protein,virulence plasmid 28 protein n=2 Tax=Microcystis aeruginosa TaxID=1126 RepID=A0A841UW99_MICAE|nr:PA14 domain-containing protein,virulence plasmid 28 protein [Microcystis aeruginosa BLCC-F158]